LKARCGGGEEEAFAACKVHIAESAQNSKLYQHTPTLPKIVNYVTTRCFVYISFNSSLAAEPAHFFSIFLFFLLSNHPFSWLSNMSRSNHFNQYIF